MKQEPYGPEQTVSELFDLHNQIHDLTRRYVEEVLKSRGELDDRVRMLSALLDSIGDGLTILDSEGKVIFASETARQTAGMGSKGEWLDELKHYSVYNEDGKTLFDREAVVKDVLKVSKRPQERLCLVKSERLPPGGIWVEFKSTPIFNESGEVTGAVNIFHDITTLKKASDRIHDLYNSAPCGYQSLDGEGTITDINQTELDWIGASKDDIVRKTRFVDLLAPECQTDFHEAFLQLKEIGRINGIQLKLLRGQKPPLTILWSSKVLYAPDGTFESTRGTLFDITERTCLEAQRNTLASLITHDIKNHLVAESLFLDVVGHSGLTQFKKEEQSLITAMRSTNRQFLNMTNDLLQLYRLGESGFSHDVTDTDVVELLRQITQLSEPAAQLKGVEIATNVSDSTPLVRINRLSLHHAIYNLVDNAIKYSPSGSKVMLSAGQDGQFVTIIVSDQGPGLTAEQKDRLFTAPWSLSWEGSERVSTGLGLYLAKQIVDSHGGTLTVDSSPGQGTSFVMNIPLARTESANSGQLGLTVVT